MKSLLDPTWIGVLIAILSLVVTTIFYYKSRHKKSLSYEILSESPLISVDAQIKGKLQISLNDKPVGNLHMILIRFINDGNLPISANDYERPVSIEFVDTSNIISAEFVNANPDNLVTTLTVGNGSVSIKPVLMNSGDSFTVKILVSEYNGEFGVDTRILGVKNLKVARKQGRSPFWIYGGILTTLAVASLVVLLTLNFFSQKQKQFVLAGIRFAHSPIRINERVPVSVFFNNTGFNKDDFIYTWKASGGSVFGDPDSPVAWFQAPASPGKYSLEVSATKRSDPKVAAQYVSEFEVARRAPLFSNGELRPITIRFRQGTIELSQDSRDELSNLSIAMSQNPDIKIIIAGHSQQGGPSELNLEVSRRRAVAVENFLAGLGIASARMRIVAYGGTQPMTDDRSEEGRQLNSRVEIRSMDHYPR